ECIQVHPPFKIPSEACLHSINPGVSYDVVITKTKAILQPPPYQTDCYWICLQQELSNNCYDKCRPDCIDRHYHIEVENRAYPSDQQISRAISSDQERLLNMRQNAATINIWSNYLSDVTYVHTPAMSLIQLVCYLGGLAGLWLGVSVMTVSGWLAQLYPLFQKWKGKQSHIFLHCKRHLPVGNTTRISPDDLLLNPEHIARDHFMHRPSVCSLSQFNPRF
ncbi:unnamed protein product, partial [Medioppia subpectinata]